MIDARTLLLAEQAHRAEGDHATADLLREAACAITDLRMTLAEIKRSTYLRHAHALAETALASGKHWTDKT